MTGNVGIAGGNSGVSNGATGRAGIKSLPAGANPIDARVSSPLLADLLARGKGGGYPADIKLIYSSGGDLFNQCPNVNKMRRARSTAWSSSSRRTTSSRPPRAMPTSCCRRRPSGSATTCTRRGRAPGTTPSS